MCFLTNYVGGEKGIRTPGWFDPSHAFQACAFDRSAISPNFQISSLDYHKLRAFWAERWIRTLITFAHKPDFEPRAFDQYAIFFKIIIKSINMSIANIGMYNRQPIVLVEEGNLLSHQFF